MDPWIDGSTNPCVFFEGSKNWNTIPFWMHPTVHFKGWAHHHVKSETNRLKVTYCTLFLANFSSHFFPVHPQLLVTFATSCSLTSPTDVPDLVQFLLQNPIAPLPQQQFGTKKTALLSIESSLFNRDPYNGLLFKKNTGYIPYIP